MKLFKKIKFILVIQLVTFAFCAMNAQDKGKEIAFLQTDRTVYVAGESLFYKLYVLDEATKKCSNRSKAGYIILRAAHLNPPIMIRVKIEAGMSNGSIVLPDTLTSGVYQIVAYTIEMKNFGEQQFFHKEIVIANRFEKEFKYNVLNPVSIGNSISKCPTLHPEINTDKTLYGLREKVKVILNKIDLKGNVAVSVYEDPQKLVSDKSIVETLSEYVDAPTDSNVLTCYSNENKSKILRGSVIDSKTSKSVRNAKVLLSCVDTIANLQYAVSDSNGIFQLLLNNYYDGKELFLTIKDMPANQSWKIETEDEFAPSEKWSPSLISETVDNNEYINKSQKIVYINKSYPLNTVEIVQPITDTPFICPKLFNCPVKSVYPAEFVALDNFQEIAVELLPLVSISQNNGKYRAQMINATNKMIYNYNVEPVFFLDGVFVDNINKIIGLGSDQIKKIDVIDTERIFGDLVFQGIISIMSKSNEIRNTIPAIQSKRLKNDNFNTGIRYVSTDPGSIQNKNIPYFKQLLYWNPDLEINGTYPASFEFYTTDNSAKFIIKIDGISEDGTPISSSTGIIVKNQINTSEK